MANTEADKYEVLEKIGQGSFGVIRKVRRKADGYILCRKEICYTRMSAKERQQLQAELSILQQLRHPNIVAYYEREHIKSSHDLHIYMEYCGNGDLGLMIKDLKARNEYAEEEVVWTIFAQLVSALYKCHSGEDPPPVDGNNLVLAKNVGPIKSKQAGQGQIVIHRDLKPDNVFLGEGNAVKLGDFGLSRIMSANDFASTYVGTPFYMSPEINANERYSLYSDIWALGCIIYELCSREPPFNARNHLELAQKIRMGKVAPLPPQYSRDLREVVNLCLQVNPNSRPDTAYLLNLPRVKLARKTQESVMILQRHIAAKDQAIAALKDAQKTIARLEAERESDKQVIHDQISNKLRLEWEAKATLVINEREEALKEHFNTIFEQRLTEEVEKRLASLPNSQTSSLNGEQLNLIVPPPRSSTPTAALDEPRPSSFSTEEEDFPSGTDLTSLSLEDSPLVQRTKPLKKSSRTPFTRARTLANPNEVAPSPMDIHMADPSPMSIACLSLSPRRENQGSKLRQPALRGNIFEKAAAREPGVTLFPTSEEEDEDDEVDSLSPIRSKAGGSRDKDPFKALAQPAGRPSISRQRTMPVQMHTRLNSTPNLAAPLSSYRRTPSAVDLNTVERPGSAGTSPLRKGLVSRLAVSPNRKAPPPPSQPSATALSAKKSKDNMFRAMHRNNLQGRTLVELHQARGIPVEEEEKKISGGAIKTAARMAENTVPVWDPERDEMPSPFLVKSRRPMSAAALR